MKTMRAWGLSLVAGLLLAACGGSEDVPGSGSPSGAPTTKGSFAAVVVFGDSVSDAGTYAPATGQPPIGGRFTTNTDAPATTKVWVENLATALGLGLTPAVVGFAGQSVACPAAATGPAAAATCTDYAQGGAMVTDPNGIGHDGGALTVPIVTQIDNHLARFGSFKDTDLVFVEAGLNDVFTQIAIFAGKAGQIQANAQAGKITADQANALLFQAQSEAQGAMKQAAQELAGYIRDRILAKGARYVAVMNAVDLSLSPEGAGLPAALKPVLTGLSDIFNLWLRDGLTGQPVQIVDIASMWKTTVTGKTSPTGIVFADTATPACDKAKITAITGGQITSGTSLFCNVTPGVPYNALAAGADPDTWFYADGNHPTRGGHKALGDAVLQQLQAYGWL
ncbi:MAG TPA: SGNH/GDSL hydrolase family protein [Ideonella sp.]|nr:SGNH/GDSL hydrolase family protein [Ideonella sp.]